MKGKQKGTIEICIIYTGSNKYSEVETAGGDIKTDYLLSGYTLSRWQEILRGFLPSGKKRNIKLRQCKKIDNMVTDDKCFKISANSGLLTMHIYEKTGGDSMNFVLHFLMIKLTCIIFVM